MLRDGHERIVAQKRSFIAEQKAFIARVNAGCTEVRQQVAELQKKLDKLLDHRPDAECPRVQRDCLAARRPDALSPCAHFVNRCYLDLIRKAPSSIATLETT